MNKILTTALVFFGLFIFAGVHVANSRYENDNLSQTIVRSITPHHNDSHKVNSQSSSDNGGNGGNASSVHHHRKDHRILLGDW